MTPPDNTNQTQPTTSQPAQKGETRTAIWILVCILITLPILALHAFAALARTDDIDSDLFAYYAQQLLAGQRLYADLWDNKPPGIFWIDALGLYLFNGAHAGIIFVCTTATAAASVIFFAVTKRLYTTRVAAIATVVAALYINLFYYHVGSNRPSTFYVPLELAGFALYILALTTAVRHRQYLILLGACTALSVCFRQTALALPLAVTLHQTLLYLTHHQSIRHTVNTLATIAIGGVGTLLLVIGALAVTSDLYWAYDGIIATNFGYFSRPGKSSFLPELYRWREHRDTLALPLILASAAIIHSIATHRFAKRLIKSSSTTHHTPHDDTNYPGKRPPALVPLLIIWQVAALYLALLGPSKRMLYLAIALPPLAMLAAHAIWLLMRRKPNDAAHPRFVVILAVLWLGHMMTPTIIHETECAQTAYYHRFDERSHLPGKEAADTIRKYTTENESVYMWHYLPAVYYFADRPLGQRYIVATLIDQWMERAQPRLDETIAHLMEHPPKAIVITPRTLTEMMAPPEHHPMHYGQYPKWFQIHYRPTPENECVWIYQGEMTYQSEQNNM